VSIFTQMLQRKYAGKIDSEADSFIAQAVGGTERMEKLLKALLSYITLLNSDELPGIVDAQAALGRSLANLRAAIEESEARIQYGPLPQVAMRDIHLEQLFQNLIGNAIKYRSNDVPNIRIDAEADERHWRFSIQDNGIGIDSRYSQQIFGIFKRLHREHEYSGAGVGLAICRKIVERYGGRIWVESAPGEGSTFFFSVPAA